MAIHTISTIAADREAPTREIRQASQNFPEDSYGRLNRDDIAARETRIAARLRAVEQAYRIAVDRDATPALDPAGPARCAERAPDRELELD